MQLAERWIHRIHPEAIELVELACGSLAPLQAAEVQRHCLVCDDCARQLEVLIGLRSAYGLAVPPAAQGAVAGLGAANRQ